MDQAQSGQASGQLETLIQQAIQAGIPPQQILPLLSQLQNPPGGGGLPGQCLPGAVGSAASQAVSNPALQAPGQTTLGGLQGLQALSQQPASIAAAVAQMTSQQTAPSVQQATPTPIPAVGQAQLPPGAVTSSLPWPIFQPIVSVPHFDMATYEKVNLDVQPSALPNGQDLPLNDVNTLRFFFNFGVQHARAILLRQHLQSQQANVGQNPHLLSLFQNPDTALALQQQLLRAQQAALLAGQRPGDARPGLGQPTAQMPQLPGAAGGLPGSLSMNSIQNTLAQHLARSFAPSQPSSFKPVNAPSNDPLETLLQSALLGANPAAAAQIKAAMAGQGQGNFAVPAQPLAHHLAAQQQLANQQHLEQLQHDLMRPHAINPALMGSHAASSASAASAAQAISTLTSSGGGAQTAHSNGNGGQVAVSPKNLPIPSDPMPRKPSSAQGIQDQIYELQHRGLMALRSPNPMNDALQKQIAAAASAMTSGQQTPSSATVTNSTSNGGAGRPGSNGQTQGPPTTVPVTSMPSLAAQLSAAMVAGAVFMPTSAGSLAMTNVTSHALAAMTSHAGLPTVAGANARSLTSGSSGQPSSHGTPTSTPHTSAAASNPIGIAIAATQVKTTGSPTVPLEVDGAPTLLAASEVHYSETFKKTHGLPIHGARRSQSPLVAGDQARRKSGIYNIMSDSKEDPQKKTSGEKPQVSSMINYVNSYMSQAKSQLQAQGVGIHLDPSGRPIDYSSRPIDPIFRKAREKLDDVRAYHDTETPTSLAVVGSGSSMGPPTTMPHEGDASNQQRSGACLIGISNTKTEIKQDSPPKKDESSSDSKPDEIKKEGPSSDDAQKRDAYSYDDGSPEEKRLRIASTDDESES